MTLAFKPAERSRWERHRYPEFGDARLPPGFWEKVHPCPTTGCWLWSGAQTTVGGYGKCHAGLRCKPWSCHRWAYIVLIGSLEVGLVLDHLCRTPACCNPAHLDQVTQKVNVQRGRSAEVTRARHALRKAQMERAS